MHTSKTIVAHVRALTRPVRNSTASKMRVNQIMTKFTYDCDTTTSTGDFGLEYNFAFEYAFEYNR
eukprot:4480341-Amphidinium_carterae.1